MIWHPRLPSSSRMPGIKDYERRNEQGVLMIMSYESMNGVYSMHFRG